MATRYSFEEDCRDGIVFPDGKQPRGRKGRFMKKICAILLSGLLFGSSAAAGFVGVNAIGGLIESGESVASTSDAEKAAALTTVSYASYSSAEKTTVQTLDVCDVAEGMMPAMVAITNVSVQEVQSYFRSYGTAETESCGTGIIIGANDSELLIVTNNHVIEDATTLSVCFADNRACEAVVKGCDPDNDLAVVAVRLSDIPDETVGAIRVATIGDSDSLKVGQQVVAIGNALGYGQSVTTGIVSALGRRVDTTDAIMIQTDAAINPGNSGGALLNMNGEVIGINSAKFSSTDVEGMGYAISITPAMPIIEDLMSRTTRTKVSDEDASYLGIKGEDITSSISSAYGIPQGIYLTAVYEDSPLAEAGITVKSVITHFDGIRATSFSNLENRLKYYAAGETVSLTVQVIEDNGYVEKTVEITLGRAADHVSTESRGGYGRYGRP